MAKNNRQNKSGLPGWVFFLIFFGIVNIEWMWPLLPVALVGVVFWRIGVFGGAKSASRDVSADSMQEARMNRYKAMVEGRTAESIDYLASAAGVSFTTAMKDLQRMVAEGRLGARAYINYVDKTIVLDPAAANAARSASGPARDTSQARPSASPQNRPSGGAEGSHMVSRAAESDAKKKENIPKAAPAREKKSDNKVRTALLIVGIVLIGIGVLRLALGGDTIFGIISGVLTALGGVGLFGYRGFLKKRENRFKLYAAACEGQEYLLIADLAKKAGISPQKCRSDLEAMLDRGLLPSNAYIDHGEGILVLKPGASPQQKKNAPVTEPEEDNEDRYKAILRRIRKLNDDIPDEGVSRRIDEMEDLTSRIFKAVQDKPEKEPQIKSFMSYYLPTTLKLLSSYAEFERSGAAGENITSAKAEIERILDTLVDGFRKQLDKLYESDAMDISSDIDVLETMLKRDGLTGEGSPFNVSQQGQK